MPWAQTSILYSFSTLMLSIQFYGFKYFICVNIYPSPLSCTSDTGIQWLAQLLHLEVICISHWPFLSQYMTTLFNVSSLTPFFLSNPHSFLLVGLYSNYIQNLIIFQYDGVWDTLSENMAHWHMENFKLKEKQ